jgi:RNA polymerase sigma-70 factor (ECF subfamily)
MSMPPFDFWVQGPVDMGKFFLGDGKGCEGSRLIATAANGHAAFASYKPDPAGGWSPWGIQVIEVAGDKIVGHHNFLDKRLFEAFDLPAHLD